MRYYAILPLLFFILACESPEQSYRDIDDNKDDDIRFVVLGPSLVELMHVSGLGDRIVGVDRYSVWPVWIDTLPSVGGYLDPSFEQIAALDPTSLHIVGTSSSLYDLAAELGIPCYSYSFDNLVDIYSVLDSLSMRYGGEAKNFRIELETTFDSLRVLSGESQVSVMTVLDHNSGASGMTVAGHGVFLAEIIEEIGGRVAAPAVGSWPTVSLEGVLQLAPDVIISIYSCADDTASVKSSELQFWTEAGFGADQVNVLFGSTYFIPGGRMRETAGRLSECIH